MSKNRNSSHHSSRSAGKTFFSILFSFLLAVMFTLIGVILIAQSAVMEFSINRVFDAEVIQHTKTYIEETASDYTLPTGIDVEVLDGLFTEEQVRADLRKSVAAAVSATEFEPDLTDMKQELVNRVQELFDSNGLTEEDTPEIIDTYADEILDIYKKALDVPGLEAVTSMSRRFGTYLWIALVVVIIFAIVLIVICIKLHHWPHRGLRYVVYASGGAFLMTLVAPLVLYISRAYEKLQITPQYVYLCIMNYVRYILLLFFVVAGLWLIVTIVLGIVVKVMRRKAIRG